MSENRSPIVHKLESEIALLPSGDKLWLIARIAQQLQSSTLANSPSQREIEISEMANDPQIQAELATIEREFAVTLMDGLAE